MRVLSLYPAARRLDKAVRARRCPQQVSMAFTYDGVGYSVGQSAAPTMSAETSGGRVVTISQQCGFPVLKQSRNFSRLRSVQGVLRVWRIIK